VYPAAPAAAVAHKKVGVAGRFGRRGVAGSRGRRFSRDEFQVGWLQSSERADMME